MASGAIASCQGPGGTGMTHGSGCKGRGVLMAGIALRSSRDMRAGLTFGGHAVTARAAAGHGRCHQRVIEGSTRKRGEALVTGIALRSGRDMGRGLR